MIDNLEKETFYKTKLDNFCTIPLKPLTILQDYCICQHLVLTIDDIREILIKDYSIALETGKLEIYADKLTFSSSLKNEEGTPISILLKENENRSTSDLMYLSYVNFNIKQSAPIGPSKALESFAFLGSWPVFLEELAARAIPENWAGISTYDNYPVLCQYIKYTFYRLQKEHKILIAEDGSLAAFNTGLFTPRYEDIFACFIPNTPDSETKWKFAAFCTKASGYYGKLLLSKFEILPKAPNYYSTLKEILYCSDKSLMIDYEHIIVDNIDRFPTEYLKPLVGRNETVLHCLEQIELTHDTSLYDTIREELQNDTLLFRRIQSDLNSAIDIALRMVERDYKIGIPCYYPKRNVVSLLLPIYLTVSDKPDLALIIELTDSGNYQGQTIFTLQQAYIDARMICPLTGTWLDIEEDVHE